MGEHGSWADYLYNLGFWRDLHVGAEGSLKRETLTGMFGTEFGLAHVVFAVVVLFIVAYGGMRFLSSLRAKDGIVPPKKWGFRAFLEMFADALFGMMKQVMGEKAARKHFKLIGSMAIFIFFCNIMALVPGGAVPTATLKTNLLIAAMVFLLYNFYGVKEHGLAYFKHFLGPIPWLAPLMLPIEIISHMVRPISLALRLLGNMVADHSVLFTFTVLIPIIVPVPFLFLGLIVCTVQTLVWSLLSMIYISMATAHDH